MASLGAPAGADFRERLLRGFAGSFASVGSTIRSSCAMSVVVFRRFFTNVSEDCEACELVATTDARDCELVEASDWVLRNRGVFGFLVSAGFPVI